MKNGNGKAMIATIALVIAALGLFFRMVIMPIQAEVDTLDTDKADSADCIERKESVKEQITELKADNVREHTAMTKSLDEILKELRKD